MLRPNEYKIGSFLQSSKSTKDIYRITSCRHYPYNNADYRYYYDLEDIRTGVWIELNPIYLLDDYYTLLNVDENTIKILYGTN